MNDHDFNELVTYVLETGVHPPKSLFVGGAEDWHARARLAHFLCMPEYEKTLEGIQLFKSIVDIDIDEESPEEVEEKVFALQRLSACLCEDKATREESLHYINLAIELAESTDYLYKYILRGELWADRWITLHLQNRTSISLAEADEKIEIYESIPISHNSYLYHAYRFKAQLAGASSTTLIAKDFMHKALSFMEIHDNEKEALEVAFSATHDNTAWILSEIDKATPSPDKVHWDI